MSEEFTVDELARAAGTTVRNVRAYQERGILAPPRRRGRVGVYGQSHLARLRIIGSLLSRGYTIANVAELIGAWEGGHDIAGLIGLEAAVTSPWSDETPTPVSAEALASLFGTALSAQDLARAVAADVIRPVGDGLEAPSLKLLNVAAELAREGVPLERLLEVVAQFRSNTEPVAEAFVRLIVRYIFDRYGEDSLPPPEEAPRLAALIWRLRPMVMQAIDSEVARAMEKAAEKFLGERLSHVLEHLRD